MAKKTPKQLLQAFHDARMGRKKAHSKLMVAANAVVKAATAFLEATQESPDEAEATRKQLKDRQESAAKAEKALERAVDKEEIAKQALADSLKAGGWADADVKMLGKYLSTSSRPT